jgi:mono/diheme cytochrome c family protein
MAKLRVASHNTPLGHRRYDCAGVGFKRLRVAVMKCGCPVILGLLLCVGWASRAPGGEPESAADVSPEHAAQAKAGLALFRDEVRGLLVEKCLDCHGGKSVKGEFSLATYEELQESEYIAETAADSYLIELVEHRTDPHMPFQQDKLPEESIDLLRRWIDLGAPYDRPLVEAAEGGEPQPMVVTEEDRQFWSFLPLADVAPPVVEDAAWNQTAIDRFVRAKQAEQGLHPNGPAERRVLIRRAYFDLIGLPPPADEVDAFVNDPDPQAWAKLIDRLLDSPQYGERWARHWMDVARFAESHGYEQDYDRPTAYHYRDFLIEALNQDMPYDQFVRWQLAGDELAPDDPLALKATGFLGAGMFPTQLTEKEFESARYDELDDMVGTTGVAFLGLSTGCARCHDHKFDPFPTADYYRLAAVFATTIRTEIELDLNPEENARRREEFAARRAVLAETLAARERELQVNEFATWLAMFDGQALPERPWSTWQVDSVTSSAGTEFEPLPDGSWRATGTPPAGEVITILGTSHRDSQAALRLEALQDDSLPHGGPGRADNGNFALGDLRLEWRTGPSPGGGQSDWQPVSLTNPRATHQQNADSLSIAASIDSDRVSGWAVDVGGIGKDQAAALDFIEPVVSDGTHHFRLTLVFEHPNTKHTIGRFRISTTSTAGLSPTEESSGPPENVIAAVATLRDASVASESKEIARVTAWEWFRATQPDWQWLSAELTAFDAQGSEPQLTKVLMSSEGLPHLSHHADDRGFPHFYPEVYELKRGDVHQKQQVVAPGYLQVLMRDGRESESWKRAAPPANGRTSGRRSDLADWITDVDHGAGHLLARVIVNRLWQYHFGTGIVATPNDFGFSGERPTHPDLLDWLARDLITNGWKLKRLHKQILLSAAYQQSGEFDETRATIDRENRWLWRRAPRRLEAEAIRDSLLDLAGLLDRTQYGPGTLDPNMRRRSIYFFIKRSQLVPMLMLFDWPEHLVSIGRRSSTTIAPQALMFLNSPQGREWSQVLAGRFQSLDDAAFVRDIYRHVLSREPSEGESEAAVQFLVDQTARYTAAGSGDGILRSRVDFCQALLGTSEFLFVE